MFEFLSVGCQLVRFSVFWVMLGMWIRDMGGCAGSSDVRVAVLRCLLFGFVWVCGI